MYLIINLIKIKNHRMNSLKYIIYNNNKLLNLYYQPYMILRRKICEKLNLQLVNVSKRSIYIV